MRGEADGEGTNVMAQETARAYWRFTVLWLITGSALGILCALSLLFPQLLAAHHILGYGRLIAAHRTAIIHGAMFSAVFASGYSLLPKLTQAIAIRKHRSLIFAWAGAAIVLVGLVLILAGHGSGREYADLPVWLALVFWAYLIATAIDISTLVMHTRSIVPHPSTGLLLVATILPAIVYPFALPDWWGVGLFDALRGWIGWRAIFAGSFALGAIGVGIWYLGSIKPRVIIPGGVFALGIVLLVVPGPLMGAAHLLDAPMWAGLKAMGAFAAVLGATGLLMVLVAMWRGPVSTPPGLLYIAGLAGLAIACVQGAVMVIPPIHTAFHYTTNTSAHAHLALSALMMIFLAGALMLAPRLTGVRYRGSGRAIAGAGWFIGGMIVLFLFETSAGVLQAAAFSRGLSAPDWLPMFRWLQLGVLIGGAGAFAGTIMLGRSLLRNLRVPIPSPAVVIHQPDRTEEVTVEEPSDDLMSPDHTDDLLEGGING